MGGSGSGGQCNCQLGTMAVPPYGQVSTLLAVTEHAVSFVGFDGSTLRVTVASMWAEVLAECEQLLRALVESGRDALRCKDEHAGKTKRHRQRCRSRQHGYPGCLRSQKRLLDESVRCECETERQCNRQERRGKRQIDSESEAQEDENWPV